MCVCLALCLNGDYFCFFPWTPRLLLLIGTCPGLRCSGRSLGQGAHDLQEPTQGGAEGCGGNTCSWPGAIFVDCFPIALVCGVVRCIPGYDLLKNKSDALTARFRSLLRQIKDARAVRWCCQCAWGPKLGLPADLRGRVSDQGCNWRANENSLFFGFEGSLGGW